MTTTWDSTDGFNPTYEFQFELPEPEEKICLAARHLGPWVETLCHEVEQQRDIVANRQAQLLLLQKFFEWHEALPKRHRHCSGKKRHICVFDVFEQGYHRLRLLALCLEPLLTVH